MSHTHNRVRVFATAYNASGEKRVAVGEIISRYERYGIKMESQRLAQRLRDAGFPLLFHVDLAPVGTFMGSYDIP